MYQSLRLNKLKTYLAKTRPGKSVLLWTLVFAFSSCYVSPPREYVGRSTLPETEDPLTNGWRVPRVYSIAKLPALDLSIRSEITEAMYHYTYKDPRYIKLALERKASFNGVLEEIFNDEGVPLELLSLALVESGFRTEVRSGRGAVGMWQFMKATAKSYGLKVNFFEDQRKDPILSTIAASRILKDLYSAYDDWPLALAAYNSGPARVDKALVKHGVSTFWELSQRKALPKQTRQFVPKILAAAIIEKNRDLEQYSFFMEK